MTTLQVTERTANLRHSSLQVQAWSAVVVDEITGEDVWRMRRLEDSGTQWICEHVPSRRVLTHIPSLPDAMARIRSGAALAELDARDAERALPRCGWRGTWTAARCLLPAEPGAARCSRPDHAQEG